MDHNTRSSKRQHRMPSWMEDETYDLTGGDYAAAEQRPRKSKKNSDPEDDISKRRSGRVTAAKAKASAKAKRKQKRQPKIESSEEEEDFSEGQSEYSVKDAKKKSIDDIISKKMHSKAEHDKEVSNLEDSSFSEPITKHLSPVLSPADQEPSSRKDFPIVEVHRPVVETVTAIQSESVITREAMPTSCSEPIKLTTETVVTHDILIHPPVVSSSENSSSISHPPVMAAEIKVPPILKAPTPSPPPPISVHDAYPQCQLLTHGRDDHPETLGDYLNVLVSEKPKQTPLPTATDAAEKEEDDDVFKKFVF
eukprot:GHVL01014770.1.p1 GENE.GHVL01014770.1~~GHVL01014770.1.p1  ORF type:complete len:308 (+),score=70.98 GHVL01014770.1:249-1172(+)